MSDMSDMSHTLNMTSNNNFNYCSFECYYCDKFTPTTDQREYEKHVVFNHRNKPSYPSMTDLNKNNLKPQGKKWEI